jgi:hypothetical protein
MIKAPPFTPLEHRFAKASDATLTPTGPLNVTAPRIGYVGGFGGIGLEPHPQFPHQLFGIGQHIHQMADRRTLIAADIANTVFQQCLGDGQNALAGECVTIPFAKMFDLRFE